MSAGNGPEPDGLTLAARDMVLAEAGPDAVFVCTTSTCGAAIEHRHLDHEPIYEHGDEVGSRPVYACPLCEGDLDLADLADLAPAAADGVR